MSFESLGLSAPLLRAIDSVGYDTPTPIQQKTIPAAAAGRDLLGCAQTGTGKTAAFALPILHRLLPQRNAARNGRNGSKAVSIRALVLAPTRELAAQIGECFRRYGKQSGLRSTVIFGGVNQNPQVRELQKGVDILVATPGRLLDLVSQGHVDLRRIETLVLDEADHMLDMGFLPDVRRILARLPHERQTLMFSATMPGEIGALAQQILIDPVRVRIDAERPAAETVNQEIYAVAQKNKPALVGHLIRSRDDASTIIFTRTKHGANALVRKLAAQGIVAEAIHGNKSQAARLRALDAFRSGRLKVLVATDIAARGIDVSGIGHVINFDLPQVAETYVHRIGRTGRAGRCGHATSFCGPHESELLSDIERLLRKRIPRGTNQPTETVLTDEDRRAAAETRDDRGAAKRPRRGGGGNRQKSESKRPEHMRAKKAEPPSQRELVNAMRIRKGRKKAAKPSHFVQPAACLQ